MKIKQIELEFIQGDITECNVDAIMNPANSQLKMENGLAGIIKKKGGPEIEREAIEKGPISIGQAVSTGAGKLKAQYIIHAVTMGLDAKTDEHNIRRATANALENAGQLNVQSLAIPALGCGAGGFPVKGAAKIMAQEVLKFARRQSTINRIVWCLSDEKTYQTFKQHAEGYIHHIQENLGLGPYATVDIIIELEKGIILIERSNPPYGWALPGGFVDSEESLEQAAVREAKEETHMELAGLRQFHTYSDPGRDPRFHTISTVFIAQGRGNPQFGDDAQGLKIVPYQDLLKLEYAFDHFQVIKDYLQEPRDPG